LHCLSSDHPATSVMKNLQLGVGTFRLSKRIRSSADAWARTIAVFVAPSHELASGEKSFPLGEPCLPV